MEENNLDLENNAENQDDNGAENNEEQVGLDVPTGIVYE
jgi:hypothetical protein